MRIQTGTVSVWSSSINVGIIIVVVVVVLRHEQYSRPLVSCAQLSPAHHGQNNTQI